MLLLVTVSVHNVEWGHPQEVCCRLSIKIEKNGREISGFEDTSRRETEWVSSFSCVILICENINTYIYTLCACWAKFSNGFVQWSIRMVCV